MTLKQIMRDLEGYNRIVSQYNDIRDSKVIRIAFDGCLLRGRIDGNIETYEDLKAVLDYELVDYAAEAVLNCRDYKLNSITKVEGDYDNSLGLSEHYEIYIEIWAERKY